MPEVSGRFLTVSFPVLSFLLLILSFCCFRQPEVVNFGYDKDISEHYSYLLCVFLHD